MEPEDARLVLRCVSIGAAVVITAIAASLGKAAVDARDGDHPGWRIALAVLVTLIAGAMVGVAFAIGTRSYRFI